MIKAYLLPIIKFVKKLLDFGQWFTNRRDNREERANKTQAVKEHDKNSSDIDSAYPPK
jgi:hypothetical protein